MSNATATAREQVIASLRTNLLTLGHALEHAATIATAAHPADWVLENQGFYLRFDTDGKPQSCGLLSARIFSDPAVAHALARGITNGNGRRPVVVRYTAALEHEIAEIKAALAAIPPAIIAP